ncbi:MAG: DUF4446 family protein [Abditibacteriota bacterium]|nr:DUF4446 family protein [Abditibacteriota bacterium]
MTVSIKAITAFAEQNLLWITFGLAITCVLLLILVIILFVRTKKPRTKLRPEDLNADKVVEALENLDERLDALQGYAKSTHEAHEKLADKCKGAFRNIAIERYDAFPDCGGKQSFSVALLDENRDGLLIRGIATRDSNRTYFNQITKGEAEIELSDEDKAAISKASS